MAAAQVTDVAPTALTRAAFRLQALTSMRSLASAVAASALVEVESCDAAECEEQLEAALREAQAALELAGATDDEQAALQGGLNWARN